MTDTEDIKRRLQTVEERLQKVEDAIHEHSVTNAEIRSDLKHLCLEFQELKADFVAKQELFLNKVWRLLFSVVLFLCTITGAVLGIRHIPNLF